MTLINPQQFASIVCAITCYFTMYSLSSKKIARDLVLKKKHNPFPFLISFPSLLSMTAMMPLNTLVLMKG